jgi:hypothetical protein
MFTAATPARSAADACGSALADRTRTATTIGNARDATLLE